MPNPPQTWPSTHPDLRRFFWHAIIMLDNIRTIEHHVSRAGLQKGQSVIEILGTKERNEFIAVTFHIATCCSSKANRQPPLKLHLLRVSTGSFRPSNGHPVFLPLVVTELVSAVKCPGTTTTAPMNKARVLRDTMLLSVANEVTQAGDYFSAPGRWNDGMSPFWL
ncbi:hypothetical protein BDZ45DRAFT_755684 [Acephala macrosclerotiorum]|nr:hypothetical protein BDZ45DRAFT_755684 [Acephala macrosclerotiorum]